MLKESEGEDIIECMLIARRQKMELNDNFTWTEENITSTEETTTGEIWKREEID